jgi:undecaprenyl diphosphate synthase
MQHSEIRTFHVGIIMDGNGRWAEARGLSRIAGHARGARRVTEIVNACPGLGISHLTLFAFSTENWQRPLGEVEGLMRIFSQYIRNRMDDLVASDVRVRFIGMRHRISPRLRGLMEELEARTRGCRGLQLTLAIDYGGRDELTRAVRALAAEVAAGRLDAGEICEPLISRALDTRELPDPDFIIRTSGELRVSNFLLWQSIYAEYDFPEVAWPDFSRDTLAEVVSGFRSRERRFGRVGTLDLLRVARAL